MKLQMQIWFMWLLGMKSSRFEVLHRMIDWLIDWIDWSTALLIDSLIDWLMDWHGWVYMRGLSWVFIQHDRWFLRFFQTLFKEWIPCFKPRNWPPSTPTGRPCRLYHRRSGTGSTAATDRPTCGPYQWRFTPLHRVFFLKKFLLECWDEKF